MVGSCDLAQQEGAGRRRQGEIAGGKEVVLDVSPPALGGVTIDGKLSFADKSDLELTTEWVMVHGELEVGTEARPFTHKATITLTDNVKDEEVMGMGDRGHHALGRNPEPAR